MTGTRKENINPCALFGGRVETEGLHFIYRAIIPYCAQFVNRYLKNFSLECKNLQRGKKAHQNH